MNQKNDELDVDVGALDFMNEFENFYSFVWTLCDFNLQNFEVVPVKEAGTFFNGDSYIVYYVTDGKGKEVRITPRKWIILLAPRSQLN